MIIIVCMFLFTKHFWKIGISHLHHHSYNLDTVTGAMSTRHVFRKPWHAMSRIAGGLAGRDAAPWRSRFCFFGAVIAQGTVEQWLLNPCWWMITGENIGTYGKSMENHGKSLVSMELVGNSS